jgi:hypothetical protein
VPYDYNETISVSLNSGLKYKNKIPVEHIEFTFTTCSKLVNRGSNGGVDPEEYYRSPVFNDPFGNSFEIPEITVITSNNPAPGKIFLSNFPFSNIPNTPYLIIAENSGQPYFAREVSVVGQDFKKQKNGNLTYFNEIARKFYELDKNYRTIDSFYCGNGYVTDLHELILLENRNALLMSYDSQTVDMSQIVIGGNPAAIVAGLIIQEIDTDKNVVFQWRSWDYFQIIEAIHSNLTAQSIDYVHGNAIEPDLDGNLLISSRHLDQITKINRTTGDIIWRLGGLKNEFTFINDQFNGFTFQHDIRRLPGGNITLFDNGNFHTPRVSRALEYTLNEVNMTARLVWEYRHNPDLFGMAMGSVQRLENGNTFICWGSANPNITEVTPNGSIALELSMPNGIYTYRSSKNDWNGVSLIGPGYIPIVYSLKQNYPNPFNPATTIEFEIPASSFVSLRIYDVLGRLVSTIVNEEMTARNYVFNINTSDLSAGIYFYTLRAGDFAQTKKMVLIK